VPCGPSLVLKEIEVWHHKQKALGDWIKGLAQSRTKMTMPSVVSATGTITWPSGPTVFVTLNAATDLAMLIHIRKNLKCEFFVIRDDSWKSEEIWSDPNYSKLIRSPNYLLWFPKILADNSASVSFLHGFFSSNVYKISSCKHRIEHDTDSIRANGTWCKRRDATAIWNNVRSRHTMN
jgi:hypothetical protein